MDRSPEKVATDLSGLVSCPVMADDLSRALYATDASIYQITPTCVVLPKSVDDVVACLRYAAETNTPIVPRGGGSGLAGETLTTGIVLDFTRTMDRVIETDLDEGWVRCQPGVILERLNHALGALGLLFGPDPSSGNRAAIGGVVGNNATGSHSIRYGYTDAYIEELEVVLADGTVARLRAEPIEQLGSGAADELTREVAQLIQTNEPLIEAHMPAVRRNRSGYALNKVVQDGCVHLGRLIAGSEGTLAIITEARLRVLPRPKAKGLLQLNFESNDAMAQAVPIVLGTHPAACEAMDGGLLGLARQAYPRYRDVLPSGVASSLVIEHDGENTAEVREKIERTRHSVDSARDARTVLEPADQREIWNARKAAVPLLFRRPGPTQPVPVIEDAAVPPERLAEYLAGLDAISKRNQAELAVYGHAGDGEFHVRPFLDLHDPAEVAKMRSVAEETFELVWSLGGTISGEHGEGLVRVEFIRRQYGPLYDVMRDVKRLFDPEGILNPGKIINDDPAVMTRNLRFAHRRRPERLITPKLLWRSAEMVDEVERCNGNAECRSLDFAGTMCPIFRATRDEVASPRAHANLLRQWLTGHLDESLLYSDEFKAAVATCVNCKTCHQACPSAVNIPKLMLEARAQIAARRGLSPTESILAHSGWMSALGSATAPIANATLRRSWFRVLMELITGIDRRRPMPPFATGSFLGKARRIIAEHRHDREAVARVAVFFDLYANYHDHELGRAIIDVLLRNHVDVVVPDQLDCQMPALCYGDIETVRAGLRRNVAGLAEAVRDGYTIVSAEPTATLMLREEMLDVIDSAEARLVAENTRDLCEFLLDLREHRKLSTDFAPIQMNLGYHMPCHLGALKIGRPGLELLRLIPGIKVKGIQAGCCGLAGTFGFQKKNFDVAMAAGSRLSEALREDSIEAGTTECATCKMQMELGGGKPVWHPVRLLSRAYSQASDR